MVRPILTSIFLSSLVSHIARENSVPTSLMINIKVRKPMIPTDIPIKKLLVSFLIFKSTNNYTFINDQCITSAFSAFQGIFKKIRLNKDIRTPDICLVRGFPLLSKPMYYDTQILLLSSVHSSLFFALYRCFAIG